MNDDLETRLDELLAERGKVSDDSVAHVLGSIDVLPPRSARSARLPFAAMAAVVLVAVVGLVIATSFRGPSEVATPTSPLPSIPSLTPSPSTAVVAPSSSATMQPRPVWAMNLADHLDCEGPPSTMGMDVPAVPGPFDPAPRPEEALDNIRLTYSNLPTSGFTPPLVDGHWALHRYLVNGRAKVHAVSTNLFPEVPSETRWEVVGLRTCDPSEYADADFGPNAGTIWFDSNGDPVRTDRIYSHEGGSHCFGTTTVLLSYYDPEYTQYVRDPGVEFEQQVVVPFDPDVRLPSDAVDTGLHTDDWHLFTIPSGRAVFVRTADGTYELWPRAKEPIGCA
jgi:hypothetical protein